MLRSPRRASRTDFPHTTPVPSTNPGRAVLALVAAGLLMAGFVSAASAQEGDTEGFQAYVNTTALNLRSAPGTQANVVGILLKYDRITVQEQTRIGPATWYSVEAAGGYTNGWVNARYVEFGEAPSGALPEGPVDYGAKQTPTIIKGDFKYQGPGVCRECHLEPTGDFHLGASVVWQRHVHSQAFQSLKREYTKEIARRTRGVDDPVNDWRCVKCHTTAYGAPESQIAPSYSNEDGVTCEVCHGPSSRWAKVDHGPDVPNREAMGFRILRNLDQRRVVCTSCHNPASPTYVPFNLREFSRDIAHWVDPGDKAYYADATAEAKRRQAAVENARQAKAEQELAARRKAEETAQASKEDEEAARMQAEKAAKEKAEKEKAEQQRLAALSAQDRAEAERMQAEKAKAEAQAEAEKKKAEAEKKKAEAERQKAEAAAEAKRMEEAERQKAEAERQKAEAALAQQKAGEAERAKAAEKTRKQAEKQALESASKSKGVERFLEDVDEVIILNPNGKKYNKVKFNHLAHASKKYLPDGECQTCHHTQEGDESPEACNSCHDIGGDADEDKAKKRYVHTKDLGFPKEGDQEQVSCVGCHKSQNELLAMGKRSGKKAPTKCTHCHERK